MIVARKKSLAVCIFGGLVGYVLGGHALSTAGAAPPRAVATSARREARASVRAVSQETIPAPQAANAPSGWTLEDLQGLALANQPTLRLAGARVAAARGRWIQAGLLPNPTAGYVGTQMGDEGTAGQQGGFVSQELITAGKLRLSRGAAAQEIRALEREVAVQRLRVLTDVRIQFYEVLIAGRAHQVSEELAGIGRRGFEAAEKLYGAQEVSQVDVLQSRIERDSSRVASEAARNRYLAAWRRLAATLGLPGLQPGTLIGDIESSEPPIEWEEALARLRGASPEVAAARARLERARWMLDRARVEPLPNVETMASVQHDNATGDDIASAQIGVQVPLFNRNQGGIREAQAEVAAARAELGRVCLALQDRLAEEFRQYATARQQVETYQKTILPDARASLEIVAGGYRHGESYLNLLTAQRTLSQVNTSYLDALLVLRRSEAMIEGFLLSGSLAERK